MARDIKKALTAALYNVAIYVIGISREVIDRMRFSPDDMRKALVRSRNASVTLVTREILRISGALLRSPPYFDLARRLGQQAARRKAVDAGIKKMAQSSDSKDSEPGRRPFGIDDRLERSSSFDLRF